MIVIDTSALITILSHEPERLGFSDAILAADRRLVTRSLTRRPPMFLAKRGVNGLPQ